MFNNQLYTNRRLNQALVKDGKINTHEQKGWFYKAWNKNRPLGKKTDLETPVLHEVDVINKMDALRSRYRIRHEQIRRVFPPARPFNEQKAAIQQSKIFQVFRAMPKCSLLHIHGAAALSVEGLMELLRSWDGFPIYVVFENKTVITDHNKIRQYVEGALVYDVTGLPRNLYEYVKDFLEDPDNETWLRERVSMCSPSRTEAIPYIWDEFNDIFQRTSELFESREFYYRYTKRALEEMRADHIEYVELRCGYQTFHKRDRNECATVKRVADEYEGLRTRDSTTRKLEEIFGQSHEFLYLLHEMNQEMQSKKENIEMRVILCARRDLDGLLLDPRSGATEKLKKKTDYAILLKRIPLLKEFLLGFDYVSEEDRGKMTYSYYHRLIYGKFGQGYEHGEDAVRMLCEVDGIPPEDPGRFQEEGDLGESNFLRIRLIDFYLHDGESIWCDNDNVVDAAICSRYRIGHGFNMNRFQTIIDGTADMEEVKLPDGMDSPYKEDEGIVVGDAKGLILEICPISNQLLRYFPDLRNHTAYDLMKKGIQCVLGNDDPQILGNPGLSYDFWEAYVGMGLSMNAVKGLVFNAYAWKRMLDGNLTEVGSTVYNNWIEDFNKHYWQPFIEEAAEILEG